MIQLFISLVTAHSLADFWLQPDWMAVRKREPGVLLLHVFIHALLAWIFSGQFTNWMIPASVAVFHLVLDAGKLLFKDGVRTFLIDQVLHLGSLFGVVCLVVRFSVIAPLDPVLMRGQIWIGGAVLAVFGAGVLLGKCIHQLFENNAELCQLVKREGLTNGGRMIGQLERALIFLLILSGQPAGIGFLVAAKSVLRFGEAKSNQKLAEYVLIGTFLSFGLAIAIASLTKWALTDGGGF